MAVRTPNAINAEKGYIGRYPIGFLQDISIIARRKAGISIIRIEKAVQSQPQEFIFGVSASSFDQLGHEPD